MRTFFQQRMRLQVVGAGVVGVNALSAWELTEQADVLVFSTPISSTPSIIREYMDTAAGVEEGRLWLDVTSTKEASINALLRSRAAVVGLHPMAAPPKGPTLKGRSLAFCPVRIDRWNGGLGQFLSLTEARCFSIDPNAHDQAMALIQGLGHAVHLAQADVLRSTAPIVGGLDQLALLRTVCYELDTVVIERMLAGNPSIYENIQFENPYVLPALDRLAEAVAFLRDRVRNGGEKVRAELRSRMLEEGTAFFRSALESGTITFGRLGHLLADLESKHALDIEMADDRPGSLRALLSAFEAGGINIESIHSSRTVDGTLQFRIGLDPEQLKGMSDEERLAVFSIGALTSPLRADS